jgi:acyl carrier protein
MIVPSASDLDSASARDHLVQLIADVLNVPARNLCDDSTPETAENWDSINHIRLIMTIESEYGIVFSMSDAVRLRSIGHIRRVLRSRGAAC